MPRRTEVPSSARNPEEQTFLRRQLSTGDPLRVKVDDRVAGHLVPSYRERRPGPRSRHRIDGLKFPARTAPGSGGALRRAGTNGLGREEVAKGTMDLIPYRVDLESAQRVQGGRNPKPPANGSSFDDDGFRPSGPHLHAVGEAQELLVFAFGETKLAVVGKRPPGRGAAHMFLPPRRIRLRSPLKAQAQLVQSRWRPEFEDLDPNGARRQQCACSSAH